MQESAQNQIIKLATLKLRPYKIFIKTLLKIEEAGIVFEKDYRRLRALFQGQIILYLKKEYAKEIADNLIAIGRLTGVGNENSRLREELRTPVFAIINIMMRDMNFGGELNEVIIQDMEKAEDEFFPQLFKQAIKEALDNVLVNFSDYCLFNRAEFVKEKDGEYIYFTFLNNFPKGCRIMIGPFTNTPDTYIFFQLYVPRYVQIAYPSFAEDKPEIDSIIKVCIQDRELPLSISLPLNDSCLIKLEQEDSYNGFIPSFSFDDKKSLAFCRRNYAETAFALGQRVKYIFLNSFVLTGWTPLYEYITALERIEPYKLYPSVPWDLTPEGDMVLLR
jgi:hypothetical protein